MFNTHPKFSDSKSQLNSIYLISEANSIVNDIKIIKGNQILIYRKCFN